MTTIKKVLCAIDLTKASRNAFDRSAQHCACEQSQALHSSCGAREPSVCTAPEPTARTADEPARTCRARRRPGANRGATRRSRSHDRAACQCEESRSRRPWIQPAARVAALPGGFRRRTCAAARRVGCADCPVGRSIREARSDVWRIVHTGASCSGSAHASGSCVSAGRSSTIDRRDHARVDGPDAGPCIHLQRPSLT